MRSRPPRCLYHFQRSAQSSSVVRNVNTHHASILSSNLIKVEYIYRSRKGDTVIIKTAPQQRLTKERDLLVRFKTSQNIRPLLDDIEEPPALVLRYLDSNVLQASNAQKLDRVELKLVAKAVLEALCAFHAEGLVHTGLGLASRTRYGAARLIINRYQT